MKPLGRHCAFALLAVLTATAADGLAEEPAKFAPADLEYFEKHVRPVLVENCQRCHGVEEQKGGLRLDSRDAILAGGDTGPAIEPGQPEASLLIDAVRYGGDSYQMPPTGKLPGESIDHLTEWVALGAPWPHESAVGDSDRNKKTFDLAERSRHWAYQPLSVVDPPDVNDENWPRHPIDRFVLEQLETNGLGPAPEIDRRGWLRRVTYDLTGLPPTRHEIEHFLKDTSPEAYEHVVDRLLASPHYGERWGRHWLDLVRYAETLGHEFDYDLFHAWRYRDYVIRAMNSDVPYDQFVLEHVAGDLLETPRRHPTEGSNESILGTGFFWLCEGKHSPVDLRQTEAERVENQIDVFGKALLGLTIACARCHDHKFDAITTKDYYALAGYLKSSRYQQAFLDDESRFSGRVALLREIQAKIASNLRERQVAAWLDESAQIPQILLAVGDFWQRGDVATEAAFAATAGERQINANLLKRWWTALENANLDNEQHPLHVWKSLHTPLSESVDWSFRATTLRELLSTNATAADVQRETAVCLTDFQAESFGDWRSTGSAFDDSPTHWGEVQFAAHQQPAVRLLRSGIAMSDRWSPKLEGVLHSPDFTIEADYVHLLARGHQGRINLVIDGFTLIRDPIYGGLCVTVTDETWRWHTIDVRMWRGQRGYLELLDCRVPNLTQSGRNDATEGKSLADHMAVDEIWLSDEPQPPAHGPDAMGKLVLTDAACNSREQLAASYGQAVVEAIERWRSGAAENETSEAAQDLLTWLVDQELLSQPNWNEHPWAPLAAEYRAAEADIPAPTLGLAMLDGSPNDEYVFIRGNYKARGETVPRRFLEVLGGTESTSVAIGSGRLELAHRLLCAENPLPARVMVNRLWQHHFGRGIVASVDDFGDLGELPSHPKLLDYLAHSFRADGWSIKRMHRAMVLSSTYRMSGLVDENAARIDPANRLLHHMPLRRLEAESVRDAMLAVSGRLDRTMFGPPVLPHLTPGMADVGRPSKSGPLDGDGRRSIYVNVRRNFLSPLLVAYDFPPPTTTMGRRTSSNTPTQALSMMNNPFVRQQAELWAQRVLNEAATTSAERVEGMYLDAFGRSPDDEELAAAIEYVEALTSRAGADESIAVWTELAHVLFNVKSFVYVP